MPKPAKFDNGNKLSKQEYLFRVKNQPVNKSLYAKVKNEAKRKFKTYPSVYANKWIVKEYKKRGGKYRSKEEIVSKNKTDLIHTISSSPKAAVGKLREPTKEERKQFEEGQLFFNTSDNTLNTISSKEETNERKIVERRGDAKEGDLWVHPNTGN